MTSPVPQAGKNEEGLHAKPFTSHAGRLCRRIPTLGLRDRAGRASEFVIGGWQWEEPRLRGISNPPEDYRRSLLLMIAVIGCMFYACNYDLTWQRLSWRHWASRMETGESHLVASGCGQNIAPYACTCRDCLVPLESSSFVCCPIHPSYSPCQFPLFYPRLLTPTHAARERGAREPRDAGPRP